MKKSFCIVLCSLLLILGGPIVQKALAQEKPLKIVFFDDYAPYSFIKDGKITGVLHDILTEVLGKRMKVPIEFKAGPWARMQELVKNGEADAFCTTPTDARKEYTMPSKAPTILPAYKIYTHKDNKNLEVMKAIKSVDDLRRDALAGKFTIGSYIGSGWTKTNLEDKGVKIDHTPSQENTIMKVAFRRVDAIVNVSVVQKYSMKLLYEKLVAEGNADQAKAVKEIIELDSVIDVSEFHFCIGKKSPYLKILEEFEKTMEQATKEGVIEQILKKYQ